MNVLPGCAEDQGTIRGISTDIHEYRCNKLGIRGLIFMSVCNLVQIKIKQIRLVLDLHLALNLVS